MNDTTFRLLRLILPLLARLVPRDPLWALFVGVNLLLMGAGYVIAMGIALGWWS